MIVSILVIQNKLYFLINETFEILNNENQCKSIIFLKNREIPHYKLINSQFIGSKYAFLKFDNNLIACAKFSNMFERN